MEKVKLILSVIAICLGLGGTLTSCSENDDEPAVGAAKQIAGTYVGDITCSVLNMELKYESLAVKLVATDDATVVVTIPSFGGNGHNTLPSFDVPAVKVSGDNGIYEIATTDFSGTNDAGQFYSGMLHGTVVDGILTLEISLHIGAMPMPMTCKFISIGD